MTNMKKKLRTQLLKFTKELRQKTPPYTTLDQLRIDIDNTVNEPHLHIDQLLKQGIKECTYRYHHEDMQNRYKKYHLIGDLYYYIDQLA